ncbi:MogA/MoaB family molybdenum cofactor biosynthesis protein [Aciduricibacillus chroicocephali]|uniref:Molybdenum cofactor biosynthesis protein B n=1 Tax=Aciduricibacillus chroicocephali TaxID=3054939 RepID=A0ABY9KSI6_9BACI|nr:MogA/MoaB family molybdenum cofactor biosynthesis protein [Bacillaceae bacterium 44XB]
MSNPDRNRSVNCFVLTISDTRTEETDKSGNLMIQMLEDSGHKVVGRTIVRDEFEAIQKIIKEKSKDAAVEAILTNGGTGMAKRDVTIEAVKSLLDKEMPGFGEVFRTLSYYEDIGSSAIMSRAIAGIVNDRPIFTTPGSSGAVKLAMEKLILKEFSHIVHEAQKDL